MRHYAALATGGRLESVGARQGSREMTPGSILLAALAAWAAATISAAAEDKLKVGLIVTLSGPAAVLAGQVRDGFNLAVKTLDGELGGLDAEVIVVDDELKPDVAVTKVKGLLERDQVNFVVGPVFSNVLMAIHKPVRVERVPHLAERRHVQFRRQAVQPELLRHLVSERSGSRGARQICAGQGVQVGLPAGAELPGRQGLARRIQAGLQGRSRRRGLHAARPAR